MGDRSRPKQRGFTLVEVLVTLFIIAIGVLGVAGLQLAGMRSNHSAFLRANASLAAAALVDRMRADPQSFPVGTTLSTDDTSTNNDSFNAWAQELKMLALTRSAGNKPLASLDCSSNTTGGTASENTNTCNTGHCAIWIRWDDSRGIAFDDDAAAGNAAENMEFRICTRIPQ
jgi:type IV pilus assembly protein PilV